MEGIVLNVRNTEINEKQFLSSRTYGNIGEGINTPLHYSSVRINRNGGRYKIPLESK